MKTRLGVPWVVAALVIGCSSHAQSETLYHVRIHGPSVSGLVTRLAFDFTSNDGATNTVRILGFHHDGRADSAEIDGGPVIGGLLTAQNPADTTLILDQFFLNQVVVPFDSLGTTTAFTLDVTESGPAVQSIPDELAFFLLLSGGALPYATADTLGAGALFAIDITGQPGGDLEVFAPMSFVAPDSLILDASVVGVPAGRDGGERLRFRSVAPSPSSGRIRFIYDIPKPGGLQRVRVFDVAGRLVAEPFVGVRFAGTWTTDWDAFDSNGRRVQAGVYVVQLQMAGQSVVRRIVLTR